MKILKISFFVLIVTAIFASCQKEYSVEGSNLQVPSGTWEFKDSLIQYTGTIDSAFIDSNATTKTLHLNGKSIIGDANFSIQLFSTDSFGIGMYRAAFSQAEFDYFTSNKTIYQGDQLVGEFIVNITSLSNNQISGTFSGSVLDSSGNTKQITLGKFTSSLFISNGIATGTLGSLTGNCVPVNVSGTYVQGVALTSQNSVGIQVNVLTPGTYTITTNQVNGVVFASSGTFSSAGLQNVTLIGSGTPVDSSTQNFSVTFGSGNCNFSIDFTGGVSGDYFPTTLNSSWAYGVEGGTPSDSVLNQVISYNASFLGKTYSSITENTIPPASMPEDTLYYRKPGGDYWQYVDLQQAFGFDNSSNGEYIFLKDNVPAGTTWTSQDFNGSFGGVPFTGSVKMTLLEKSASVTIGSLVFPDVIKVKYEYFISVSPTVPTLTTERWFAKGVGLIHFDDGTNFYDIGRYQVL